MITLSLHDGSRPVVHVTVSPTDPVQVLNAYVDGAGPKLLMYNYSLIMTTFTFSFYGITDGSDLFVVRRTETRNTMKSHHTIDASMRIMKKHCFKSLKFPSYMDEVDVNAKLYERLRNLLPDYSIFKEASRLHDLHYAHLELVLRAYQSRPNEDSAFNHKYLSERNLKLNLDIPKRSEPSTDALPRCWRV